jgi:hypothetical protein
MGIWRRSGCRWDGFAKIAERWVPLITVESSLLRRWMA